MTLNEYQQAAMKTAIYPNVGDNLLYPSLGLGGESGEVLEKVKKYWRNNGATSSKLLTPEQSAELAKEVSDVLWYIAALANELGMSLDEIAEINVKKLLGRKERGTICSAGDNR